MTHTKWKSLQEQMSPDSAAFIHANVPLFRLESGSDAVSSAKFWSQLFSCMASGKQHALGTKLHCHSNSSEGGATNATKRF
jgi:hypothetical protein